MEKTNPTKMNSDCAQQPAFLWVYSLWTTFPLSRDDESVFVNAVSLDEPWEGHKAFSMGPGVLINN